MGISPKVFGPFMWATIHYICLGAPDKLTDQDKSAYTNFFNNLPYIMPCKSCGEHLKQNLITLPISNSLNTKEDLFKWSVDLHNLVNKQINKNEITLEEAYDIWLKKIPSMGILSTNIVNVQDNTKDKNNKKILIIIGIIIILLLLINILLIKSKVYHLEVRKQRSRS